MNKDTSTLVEIQQVEQAMRTLTHEWRNVLNGINLRISAAQFAEDSGERQTDLLEAQQLVQAGTAQLSAFSRKLATPSVTPIPYPMDYFLEDLAVIVGRGAGLKAGKLQWENAAKDGKVIIDFIAISQALGELIENTLRHLAEGEKVVLQSRVESGFLVIWWKEKIFGSPAVREWGKAPFLTTERGRLGLGLFFARRVIAAHAGSLEFEVVRSNLQTTLRLPLEIV